MLVLVSFAIGLLVYALRQNISLFYTPSEVLNHQAPPGRLIRLGGMVVPGSVIRSSNDLSLQFDLTDYHAQITVAYTGILPNLFREGSGVVVQGKDDGSKVFHADEVLAKHDENYMPRELKDLKKS